MVWRRVGGTQNISYRSTRFYIFSTKKDAHFFILQGVASVCVWGGWGGGFCNGIIAGDVFFLQIGYFPFLWFFSQKSIPSRLPPSHPIVLSSHPIAFASSLVFLADSHSHWLLPEPSHRCGGFMWGMARHIILITIFIWFQSNRKVHRRRWQYIVEVKRLLVPSVPHFHLFHPPPGDLRTDGEITAEWPKCKKSKYLFLTKWQENLPSIKATYKTNLPQIETKNWCL